VSLGIGRLGISWGIRASKLFRGLLDLFVAHRKGPPRRSVEGAGWVVQAPPALGPGSRMVSRSSVLCGPFPSTIRWVIFVDPAGRLSGRGGALPGTTSGGVEGGAHHIRDNSGIGTTGLVPSPITAAERSCPGPLEAVGVPCHVISSCGEGWRIGRRKGRGHHRLRVGRSSRMPPPVIVTIKARSAGFHRHRSFPPPPGFTTWRRGRK